MPEPSSVTIAGLRALAEALPIGTAIPVPRELLLELLGGEGHSPVIAVDLTVQELAQKFNRRPSTIRGWCEAHLLPGAYRNRGREWRIPAAALVEFQERERSRPEGSGRAGPGGRRQSLADWRHAS